VDEVARLRQALRPLEAEARQQRWDRERPWRVASHVRAEGGVPLIDLHDLKTAHAKTAVRAVIELELPAVVFVTGRGRHSLASHSAVKQATHGLLRKACTERPQARYRIVSPGRVAYIADPSRAPAQLVGGGGGWLWLWFALLALALVVGLWGKLG
jgi:hypothetical protein